MGCPRNRSEIHSGRGNTLPLYLLVALLSLSYLKNSSAVSETAGLVELFAGGVGSLPFPPQPQVHTRMLIITPTKQGRRPQLVMREPFMIYRPGAVITGNVHPRL
jgi:hypothetical protein